MSLSTPCRCIAGVDVVLIHKFLTSSLGGEEWSTSRPSRFNLGKVYQYPLIQVMQSFRLKQCSACADDILIAARTKQTMIDTFEELKNFSLQFGLIVNENKTKYMKHTTKENYIEG